MWPTLLVSLSACLLLLLLLFFRPQLLVRMLCWLLSHTVYRMDVMGRRNIPTSGAALLVCNPVGILDAFLLFTAQRRLVRLVVWGPFAQVPLFRPLMRLARVIPLDSRAKSEAEIEPALQAAADALAQGEVVCIFAAGAVTSGGFTLPFHRIYQEILRRTPAPVVPACMDHAWGSIFSFHGKLLWKWPWKLPYPVSVAFGPALPPSTGSAEVVQAIQKLSADCAVKRGDRRLPIHRQFVRMAARHPFRLCMIDQASKKRFRCGEVLAGVSIFTKLLRPVLGDDAMVGIWLPPSVGGAFANIACAFLGKPPINLNYTASPQIVQSAVQQCNIRHILTSRLFTNKVPLDAGPGVDLVYLEDFRKEITTWQRLRAFLTILVLPAFVLDRWVYGLSQHKPDDLATVIFSSGSTGDPKGVMLTYKNIAANSESMIQAIDPRPADRLLGILPFFHSFGFTVTLWVPLQVGTSTLYFPDPRQAKEIGELCRTYGMTIYLTTPTFLRFSQRRCEVGDFNTLRILMCGAEKLSPAFAKEFQEKFGILPLEGYGCTELSPVVGANIPDWQEGGATQICTRSGSIGQPVPGVATKIVHPETFEPLPPGQEGLLLIYGANVMKGYLGREQATRDVIRDGWYVTGDIARIDEDGFVFLTDRLSRFSKIGGEMVPHQKIEDELHGILTSSERIFAVTAVPDERKGERLVVLHTHLNGTDVHHVWQQLNARDLPNLWVPSERDFFEVPELPVLGTGKIDLKRIKELAQTRAKERAG